MTKIAATKQKIIIIISNMEFGFREDRSCVANPVLKLFLKYYTKETATWTLKGLW